MQVHIVKLKDKVKAFHELEDAVAFVSPHNYKVGCVKRFEHEDENMFNLLMEERLGNMWEDGSVYEQWREDRLLELGLTEQDLKDYTEVLFIETVEVE